MTLSEDTVNRSDAVTEWLAELARQFLDLQSQVQIRAGPLAPRVMTLSKVIHSYLLSSAISISSILVLDR